MEVKVAFKAYNGKYVCADGGKEYTLYADRAKIGEWEKFEIVPLGGSSIALKAYNGKYVCADGGKENKLYADRTKIGEWETFVLIGERYSLIPEKRLNQLLSFSHAYKKALKQPDVAKEAFGVIREQFFKNGPIAFINGFWVIPIDIAVVYRNKKVSEAVKKNLGNEGAQNFNEFVNRTPSSETAKENLFFIFVDVKGGNAIGLKMNNNDDIINKNGLAYNDGFTRNLRTGFGIDGLSINRGIDDRMGAIINNKMDGMIMGTGLVEMISDLQEHGIGPLGLAVLGGFLGGFAGGISGKASGALWDWLFKDDDEKKEEERKKEEEKKKEEEEEEENSVWGPQRPWHTNPIGELAAGFSGSAYPTHLNNIKGASFIEGITKKEVFTTALVGYLVIDRAINRHSAEVIEVTYNDYDFEMIF